MKINDLIQRIALQRREEFPFPEDLESYLEDFVPNTLLKNETLQDSFGISNYQMEEVYQEGYTYYQENQYQDSATTFRWLVILNPFEVKYWMGLAANQQLLEQFEKALHSYAIAAFLDHESPMPHYYAFECYESLNNREDAKKALDLAYERSSTNEAYQDLKLEIESKR